MPPLLVTVDPSPSAWAAAALVGLIALFSSASPAVAQAQALTMQPEAGLERLSSTVARELERRTGRHVEVLRSDDPIEGRVRVRAEEQEAVFAVDGGGEGRELRMLWRGRVSRGEARETALALEVLLDRLDSERPAAASTAASEPRRPAVRQLPELSVEAQRVASGPRTEGRATTLRNAAYAPGGSATARVVPRVAKPTIYFGVTLGYSPVRRAPIVGPGGGFGLCYGPHCMVVEANLPLVVDEREAQGEVYRYRAVDTGMRLQIRPLEFEEFSFGVTLGIFSRIGHAWIVDTDSSRTVSNFGVRGSLEASYKIGGPFEWVFEGGVDYAVTRARYLGGVFLEDRWRPYVVMALRLRP